MDLAQFLSTSRKRIKQNGYRGVKESFHRLYYGIWANSTTIYDPGQVVWDREWDILVVLDACRTDLMEEVSPDYSFLSNEGTAISNASSSGEWLRKNFDKSYRDEMSTTALVSGNPHTETDLPDRSAFHTLDEVWKYAWEDDSGTILPHSLIDRAIDIWRNETLERMIIHYMQPHFPSIPHPEFGSEINPGENVQGDVLWESVWDSLREGDVSKAEVWNAYRANLHYILSEMDLLLENVDAEKVVFTADHGNAFGEYGIYGHPNGAPIKPLRNVPWYETSATDSGTYTPELSPERDPISEENLQNRLADLGYLE